MKVIFGAQNFYDMVEMDVEALPEDATTSQRKAHKKDKKTDCNAQFLIHQSVDSNVFEKIDGETSSKVACDKLEKLLWW